MSFRGRVSVITGAASGIGRALALELADRGSDLALCDVDEEGLAETVRRVEARARRVTPRRWTWPIAQAVYAFAEACVDGARQGRRHREQRRRERDRTVADMTYDDFEWIVGINFWGVVYGTKAFLPH